MYNFTHWDLLLVDDEPDVIAISQLVMGDYEVYGLPLALHAASTKAEAVALLYDNPTLADNMALALVDVVMESDEAGLELCEIMREDIGNRIAQIFIRTGQPGVAPEKEVIDQFEINGYFTKAEATEDKLYSMVKSGIRQFLWSYMSQLYMSSFNEILRADDWRQKIAQVLVSFVESSPGMLLDLPIYLAIDGNVLVQQGIADRQITEWRGKLAAPNALRFSVGGNAYLRAANNLWGMHVVAGPQSAEVLLLCQTAFAPPQDMIAMTHEFFQSVATLWVQSR